MSIFKLVSYTLLFCFASLFPFSFEFPSELTIYLHDVDVEKYTSNI